MEATRVLFNRTYCKYVVFTSSYSQLGDGIQMRMQMEDMLILEKKLLQGSLDTAQTH